MTVTLLLSRFWNVTSTVVVKLLSDVIFVVVV
jgi:hypothetical protein